MNPKFPKEAFISPQKFHLTIALVDLSGTMPAGFHQAISSVLAPKALSIVISGIDILKGTPKECDLLYARIECSELQDFGSKVQLALAKMGMLLDFRPIVWHATICNSRYNSNRAFDVSAILNSPLKDFAFGTATVDQIHASCLLERADPQTGYYKNICTWLLQAR